MKNFNRRSSHGHHGSKQWYFLWPLLDVRQRVWGPFNADQFLKQNTASSPPDIPVDLCFVLAVYK